MKMKECPYFFECSAPLCPLDPDLKERTYQKGEPVCRYVRWHTKGQAVPKEILSAIPIIKKIGGSNLRGKLK